jgi:hypothetical protein
VPAIERALPGAKEPRSAGLMHPRVACSAERNQILFHVAARLAPEFEVVHLQVLHGAARLAPPAVAFQYLPMQLTVALGIESESWVLWIDILHEAFRLTSERNACCCGLGRNL